MTKAQKEGRGARAIVKDAVRDTRLTPEARFLWLLIESFANKDGTNAFPSQDTLAELANRDVRWVRRYTKELESEERIFVNKIPCDAGTRNYYTLLGGKECTPPVVKRNLTQSAPQLPDIKCTPTGLHSPETRLPSKRAFEDRTLNGHPKKLPHLPKKAHQTAPANEESDSSK